MKWSPPARWGHHLHCPSTRFPSIVLGVVRLSNHARSERPLDFQAESRASGPVHGRGPSRGVEVVEREAVDGEDVVS